MATEIDILIKATDQASGPLKNVSGAVDNLGKKADGASKGGLAALTKTLGTSLKVGALAGVAGITALGAAVVTTGVSFNNLKQQANIAFTTMLGSGEKAKIFMDDLQQFAAATPFEFPELLSASQRLLAMGFAAEDVRPTLTAVGDAVAALGGSGELVGRVTTALGQMQAKGKASAEEMAQLTEAGIPGWKFLAEAIGTDVAGAMDQVSKGAIDAETVINALTEGMNRDFGGMMEKQSQTFGGLLSTLQDTFTQVSGTVMAPLFDLITDGLAKVVEWVSKPEFAEGVAKFAESVRGFVEFAANGLTNIAGELAGKFNTIQGQVTNAIGWIRLAWDADWASIRKTWDEFSQEMPRLHAEFWEEWHNTFGGGSQQNVNDWENFFEGLGTFATSWWRLTVTNWTLSLKLLRGEWQIFSNLFKGDWEATWEGFKLALFSVTDIILNYIEFVFGPGLRDKFAGALNGIWDTLKSWWETLSSWWNSTVGRLPGFGGVLPSVNIAPPAVGASTSNVTNTTGPISVTFNGPADQTTVQSASNVVTRELRLRGAN